MKRYLSWFMALTLVFSFVTLANAEEKPVVTALIYTSQLPAENNSVLDEIRARTGIDFQPTMVENASYVEKFNTLAAAGMLPDIVRFTEYSQTMELVENGVLLPLDDLLATHGQEILQNRGDTLYGTIAQVDGKVYGIATDQARVQALMVRKDWLDNLGLEAPTTLEDFHKVLSAFTNDDPDQDGQKDTVGLGVTMAFPITMEFLFSAHGISYNRPVLVDGQVKPYFMHPNYLKAIEYIRTLYSEGLIEPDFVTIANMSCLEKLWNGTYGFYFGDPIGTTNNWFPGRYTEDPLPVMTYTTILGEDGVGGSRRPVYNTFWGITSSCKNPEAAMDLLNYLCTEEGNLLAYAGIEGKHWEWNDNGGLSYIGEYTDSTAQRNDGGYMYFRELRFDGIERQLLNDVTKYGYELGNKYQVEDANIMAMPEIDKNITFNHEEMLATLIVSQEDPEALYDSYILEYLDNGGSTWIEQATAIYMEENNK